MFALLTGSPDAAFDADAVATPTELTLRFDSGTWKVASLRAVSIDDVPKTTQALVREALPDPKELARSPVLLVPNVVAAGSDRIFVSAFVGVVDEQVSGVSPGRNGRTCSPPMISFHGPGVPVFLSNRPVKTPLELPDRRFITDDRTPTDVTLAFDLALRPTDGCRFEPREGNYAPPVLVHGPPRAANAIVVVQGRSCEVPPDAVDPRAWTEHAYDPGAHSCADDAWCDWHLDVTESRLRARASEPRDTHSLPPSLRGAFGVRAPALVVDDGILFGLDGDSMASGLWWAPPDASRFVKLASGHVRALVSTKDGALAFTATPRSSLSNDQGGVLRLSRASDGWAIAGSLRLPGSVEAVGVEPSGDVLVAGGHLADPFVARVVGGARVDVLHRLRNGRLGDMTSIAVDDASNIFVGSTSFVVKLTPVPGGYRETRLHPDVCFVDGYRNDCRCSP